MKTDGATTKSLENILKANEYQLKAMRALQGQEPIGQRLDTAIEVMREYYEADRTYIFRIDDGEKTMSNISECCGDGISPQIDMLQKIDRSGTERWMSFFNRSEPVVISDVDMLHDENPGEYALLSRYDIHSCIEAPIILDGKLEGFIGADNPSGERIANTDDLLISFSYSIAAAIARSNIELQLQIRADELENVVDNIPVGVSMIRVKDGKAVSKIVNPLLCDLYGVAHDNADNADEIAMSRIQEDYRDELLQKMRQLHVPGTTVKATFPYHIDGEDEVRWYKMTARSTTSDDGLLYFSCLSDITSEREVEAALRQSRKMYEAATEMADIGVWVYDCRTHTITLSDNGTTERDQSQFKIPKTIENVPESNARWVDEKDLDKLRQLYRSIDEGAPTATCEYWYKHQVGIRRRCERIFYMTVFDDDGKPVSAYGIGIDVTSQKIDEERYNNLYAQMAKVNPESLGTFHLNITQNTCDQGQSPFQSVLRQGESGTVDGYLEANAVIIADEKIKEDYLRQFTRQKLLQAFGEGRTELFIEYPVRSSKGRIIWIDGFVNMVMNPDTHDVEAITYALNVTDRKIDESIVNRITEDTCEMVALIDPEARTFELRRSGWFLSDRMLDDSASEDYDTIRNLFAEHVAPDDRDLFLARTSLDRLITTIDKDGELSIAFRGIDASAKTVPRKQIRFRWLDSSHKLVIGIQSDVTMVYDQEQEQMRQLQQALHTAEEANAAKSDFLSRMSHDIRTPLNGIIGMTYLASQLDNSPQMAGYLHNIDTSSKFLLGLINDVLDMSKAESGMLEMHPEPYDPKEFFEYLDAVIVPLCKEKDQRFIIDAEPVAGVAAIMDPLRINQVFFNLLSNAVKYTPEGGTITYRLREHLLDNGRLSLQGEVSDTGIGMSERFQKVLFDPFTQENRSDVSNTRGSGLGLAIVKKIIDAMDGTISVRSRIGEGTTFIIRADVDCVPIEQAVSKHSEDETSLASSDLLSGTHILLFEDHPLNQEIARTLLEEQGAVVTVCDDGRRGVETFGNSGVGYYDAILMDIRMPVMDGYEATRAIRGIDRSDARSVPIIAMTADAFSDDVQRCLDAGMDAHIAKPIDPGILYSTIRSMLDPHGTIEETPQSKVGS